MRQNEQGHWLVTRTSDLAYVPVHCQSLSKLVCAAAEYDTIVLSFLILKLHLFIYCVCEGGRAHGHRGQRSTFAGVHCVLPLCEPQGSNSGREVWQRAPLQTGPLVLLKVQIVSQILFGDE